MFGRPVGRFADLDQRHAAPSSTAPLHHLWVRAPRESITKMNSSPNARLDENLVKTALAALDWGILKRHFDDIGLTEDQFTEVCGHARRCTDLIYKYPRKTSETGRARLFDEFRAYAAARFGQSRRCRQSTQKRH